MRAAVAGEVTMAAACGTTACGVTATIRLPACVVISRVAARFVDR